MCCFLCCTMLCCAVPPAVQSPCADGAAWASAPHEARGMTCATFSSLPLVLCRAVLSAAQFTCADAPARTSAPLVG